MAIVDYTQAMTAGLGARLAYNKANRSGGGRIMAPRGEDLNQRHHRQAMEKSALAQSKANVDMTTSTTSDNKDKTKANISKMQADTARRDSPEAKAMAKAQLDNEKQNNVKTALSNFSSFVPAVTQETWRDLVDWGAESGVLPRELFTDPDKVEGMSELEFKKWKSGAVERYGAMSDTGVKLAVKQKEMEIRVEQKRQEQVIKTEAKQAEVDDEKEILLTDEEARVAGAKYNLDGKMPSLGRGKVAAKNRIKILKSGLNQQLGLSPDQIKSNKSPMQNALEIVAMQSDTKAIQGAQKFLEKQLGSMDSFVTNLNSQVDKVKALSKDLETFDTRIMNVPLRLVRGKILGSPLQAKYDMYLAEIEGEIGKLATGSTASIAELSATAQERWAKIHDKNLSVTDMLSLLEETKNAANLRYDSVVGALSGVRKRMRTRDYDDSGDPSAGEGEGDDTNDPLGLRQ